MKFLGPILFTLLIVHVACAAEDDVTAKPPNIVIILADDLGYAELGSYGQEKIQTPHIDRLAAEGMRFTQHYSGSPVCAPSRCTLLTGRHTGHAYVRANKEMGGWERDAREGQLHLPESTQTLAHLLQRHGYTTGGFGKWGLGGPDTSGHPNQQGFDHWFGYLCQRIAHNYYPEHVWDDQTKHALDNPYFSAHQKLKEVPASLDEFDRFQGNEYAPDVIADDMLKFVRENKDEPFFVYYATIVPHVSLQVPDDSVAPYLNMAWDAEPYLGQKGYLPHPTPRAAYAAMITRMDDKVGKLLDLLDELELADDTIVFFTSDNGPTFNGGTDSTFFESAGPLRGLKTMLYEGGIRVPMIVRWPEHVEAGSTSDHISAFWDVLPTVCDVVGINSTMATDGISMAPMLLGNAQVKHEYLYWEYRGSQAIRLGRWKAFWKKNTGPDAIELYDLETDIAEAHNVATAHPELMVRIQRLFSEARSASTEFPLKRP